MIPAPIRRSALSLIALVGVLGIFATPAGAETTTETGVTITIVDEGELDVSWGEQDTTFLTDGESPALSAANPSATATATFSLTIADTRAERDGYRIVVSAGSFTAGGSATPIGPEMLAITGVGGLPEVAADATAIGATLDAPVTILTVPDEAAAVTTTVTVTIAMTIAPGTMPGAYTGEITLDILPVTGL